MNRFSALFCASFSLINALISASSFCFSSIIEDWQDLHQNYASHAQKASFGILHY
jgi:hypothetical protein